VKVGQEVNLKCRVTDVVGDLVRLEAMDFKSPIGYWLPITVVEHRDDYLKYADPETAGWTEDEVRAYQERHQV
jgi:hypothetical protein